MSEWAPVAVIAIIATYKLIEVWLHSRTPQQEDSEPDKQGAESRVESVWQDPARDDSERSIPDIRLGFQRED